MAKCKAIEVPVVKEYQLTLTQEEADCLRDIGWRIGGNAHTTWRSLMDDITNALENAGVNGIGGWDISYVLFTLRSPSK